MKFETTTTLISEIANNYNLFALTKRLNNYKHKKPTKLERRENKINTLGTHHYKEQKGSIFPWAKMFRNYHQIIQNNYPLDCSWSPPFQGNNIYTKWTLKSINQKNLDKLFCELLTSPNSIWICSKFPQRHLTIFVWTVATVTLLVFVSYLFVPF